MVDLAEATEESGDDAAAVEHAEEYEQDWYAVSVSPSEFGFHDPDFPRFPDSDDRREEIRRWAEGRGGLRRALEESPVIIDREGRMLDGSHRTSVWLQDAGDEPIPALVGDYDSRLARKGGRLPNSVARLVDPAYPYLFDIDPDQLVFTERGQRPGHVAEVDPDEPITATEMEGVYYVVDGHHRVLRARQEDRPVRAVVIPGETFVRFRALGIHQAEMFSAFARELLGHEP